MRNHGFGDLQIVEPIPVLEQRRDNALQQFHRANAAHRNARPGSVWQQVNANDAVNWMLQVEILDCMIELALQQQRAAA